MLQRWGIRLGGSLAGIALGLVLASLMLDNVSIGVASLIQATIIFFAVHFVVQVIALRTLIRQPSIALAGLLALASTVVSLVIVNLIVSGFKLHGPETYIFAALIVWVTTAAADVLTGRKLRERRLEDR